MKPAPAILGVLVFAFGVALVSSIAFGWTSGNAGPADPRETTSAGYCECFGRPGPTLCRECPDSGSHNRLEVAP